MWNGITYAVLLDALDDSLLDGLTFCVHLENVLNGHVLCSFRCHGIDLGKFTFDVGNRLLNFGHRHDCGCGGLMLFVVGMTC